MIYLESLPDELIEIILYLLPCKYILNLYDMSNRIKDLCDKNNIIHEQKYIGFPRISGSCKIHYISSLIFKYDDDDCQYTTNEILSDFKNPLSTIVDKLYELNYDLVRGDIIRTVYLDYVFNGCKLININNDELQNSTFNIINNSVSINYWDNFYKDNKYDVWFDHQNVKYEMIQNIKVSDNDISISFVIGNTEYGVICNMFGLRKNESKVRKIEDIILGYPKLQLRRKNNNLYLEEQFS